MTIKLTIEDATEEALESDLKKLAARLGGAASGSGDTPPPSGGTDTPPPASDWAGDPNLPYAMPATYAAGASITLGTPGPGKKRLEMFLNGNPNSPADSFNYIMPVASDGKKAVPLLDTPIKILSRTGETKSGAMNLIIYAVLPEYAVMQLFLKAAGGDHGIGIDNLCFQGATLDYQDLVGNGNWTSHADQAQVNGKTFDVFNGQDIVVTAPIVPTAGGQLPGGGQTSAYPTPARDAQPTIISGATVNGVVTADTTLALLFAALPDGAKVVLPAITIIGSAHLTASNVTVTGAGGAAAKRKGAPQTILSCAGFRPFQDKAIIVVDGDKCTFQGLAFADSRIGDPYGADGSALRNGDAGVCTTFTAIDCEFYGCEDGILTQTIGLTLLDNWFHDNGVPPASNRFGYDHDAYNGGPNPNATTVSKRNVYERATCAHGLKCRVGNLISEDDTFIAGGNGAGLDMPDGGKAVITRGSFTMPLAAGPTLNLIAFAMESALNSAAGMELDLIDPTWNDVAGTAILAGGNSAKLNISGNAVAHTPAGPDIKGWDAGNVTGAFTKA